VVAVVRVDSRVEALDVGAVDRVSAWPAARERRSNIALVRIVGPLASSVWGNVGGKVVAGVAPARVPILIVWWRRPRLTYSRAHSALIRVPSNFEAMIGAVECDFAVCHVLKVADVVPMAFTGGVRRARDVIGLVIPSPWGRMKFPGLVQFLGVVEATFPLDLGRGYLLGFVRR
jgi:hypothetical protein